MADQYAIRPITDDEYAAFRRVHEHSFNSGPAPAARWPRMRRQFEADRSLARVRLGAARRPRPRRHRGRLQLPDGRARRGAPGGRRVDGRGAPHPPAARHPALDDAPPARRHRGPGAGADRGAMGRGNAAVRPVRVRAGVLARILPVPPRRGRAQPDGARRPGADAPAGRAGGSRRGPGQGLCRRGSPAARVLRARRRLVGAGARRPRGGTARGQPAALPAGRRRRRRSRLRALPDRRPLGGRHRPARLRAHRLGAGELPTRRPARPSGATCSAGTWSPRSPRTCGRPTIRCSISCSTRAGPGCSCPTTSGCGSSTCPPR